ncbi:hypothetical protein H2199_002565 [Coniosporium tulheliwenetii]|uniref:Uncharacterized protein n=1 Tax=Coniosporium tulheliwenetii TaxID=3383036 RepID=A0ACC2ZFF6_9PEZI|nr:hypothetical protein H2199_002565 [Cladosporium sp. JES 115]
MTRHHRTLSTTTFDLIDRYATSWLLPPTVLCATRALISLFAFATILFLLLWDTAHGNAKAARQSFSFFTNLTFWGIAFYFAFAAAHTGSYAFRGQSWLSRWPRALQEMHGVFYSTVVVFPFLVTIVFWALLYSSFPTPYVTWRNVSTHALNSVFALLEIIVPRTEPMPWWHLIPLIILLAMYLGVAFVTYATQGFFVYGFLDWRSSSGGAVAGYVVGILAAMCVLFVIVRYSIWVRVWATEKKWGMTGKRSARESRRQLHSYASPSKDTEMASFMNNVR